ncbi:hypothetical protein FRC03_003978 [Tulasnella sp. 419]|nr:hypothetical protein FRC03_003978 [Tulasnella sp. 419]
MDYLRNLGSAAASSLLQKSGLTLPFSLGEKVHSYQGTIWTLHDAIKKDDSSPVSVFVFDSTVPTGKSTLPLAKNALRKLRTIRHPDVLKFIDVVETDTITYIVTERIRPLSKLLADWAHKPVNARQEWLIWGLHRISVALAFINESCQSTHGNVRVNSVFISPSGEWKLGGFEVLSNPADEAAALYTLGGIVPDANQYCPPEVRSGGWSSLKTLGVSCADAYGLGILLHSVFNPSHPLPATTLPPHPPPAPSSRGDIPQSIFPSFKRLLNPNAKARFSPKAFLELGMGEKPGDGSGFFANNGLYKICASLEGFPLSSDGEKAAFLRTLKDSADSFPPEFANYKVLPSLLTSLEHGGASAAQLLPLVLQLGKNLPPNEYNNVVLTPLIKLFASPDRGTRMALLDHLPEYVEKLDNRTVTDKIWPHIQTGFGDTVAVIREATIRSIILISPKLSDRILNNDLLRYLAKSQTDAEASIRTNTCILIGRIAPTLSTVTKQKVLVPAFTRSLRDTFVHCRVAGLMALMATIDCFGPEDIASKVLPCMTFTLLDKEKLVRDQAFKAVELFMKRVETHAEKMPETALAPGSSADADVPAQYALVNSAAGAAAGAAGALAGWAVSSISKKLGAADLQSTIGGGVVDRPLSAPLTEGSSATGLSGDPPKTTLPSTSRPSLGPSTASTPGPSSGSKTKGMQLGANKIPGSVARAMLADELAAEAAGSSSVPGGWGDGDDLMDVTADAEDWSAFAGGGGVVENLNLDYDADGWGDMLEPEVAPDVLSPPPPPVQKPIATQSPAPRKPTVGSSVAAVANKHRPSSPLNPNSAAPPNIVFATSPPRTSTTTALPKQPLSVSSPVQPKPAEKAPAPTLDASWEATDWQDAESRSSTPAAGSQSLAAMSKEEKAAELARRREERKQRIAQLKEQKKAGAK